MQRDDITNSFFLLVFFLYFQGLRDSMRQAELNNWSLEPTQIADLCSSINQFFARTGVIPPLGAVQPPVCHGSMHPNKPSQHLNTGEPPPHHHHPPLLHFVGFLVRLF